LLQLRDATDTDQVDACRVPFAGIARLTKNHRPAQKRSGTRRKRSNGISSQVPGGNASGGMEQFRHGILFAQSILGNSD
jgi:hypothetical protein